MYDGIDYLRYIFTLMKLLDTAIFSQLVGCYEDGNITKKIKLIYSIWNNNNQ